MNKEKKQNLGCNYLIAYLILIAVVDGIALIAKVWLFYIVAGILAFVLWGFSFDESESDPNPAGFFYGWQIPTFLLAGAFFIYKINPISTYWDETWPGLLSLILFMVIGAIITYIKSSEFVGFFVITASFWGIIGNLFGVFVPPSHATDTAWWLYENSATIAIVFYFLAGAGILGRIIFYTTKSTQRPQLHIFFSDYIAQIIKEHKERQSDNPFETIIKQLEIVFSVILLILGYILDFIVLVIRYILNWLSVLPRKTLETIINLLKNAVTFFRCVLFQEPLHILAICALWTFASFLYQYVYLGASIIVFIGITILSFLAIAICFLAGVPLILGHRATEEYVPILKALAETIQEASPHALSVLVGSFWSLIILTHFFGIADFSIGMVTVISTMVLFGAIVYTLIHRVSKSPKAG